MVEIRFRSGFSRVSWTLRLISVCCVSASWSCGFPKLIRRRFKYSSIRSRTSTVEVWNIEIHEKNFFECWSKKRFKKKSSDILQKLKEFISNTKTWIKHFLTAIKSVISNIWQHWIISLPPGQIKVFSCANTLSNMSAVPMVGFPKALPTVCRIREITRAPGPTALGAKVSPPSAERQRLQPHWILRCVTLGLYNI